MAGYQPPYSITPQILNRVVDVGELLGHWAAHAEQSSVLFRKENRIRTIQASLAIEHNSLSMQQVTAIMEDKRVLAPQKDIQEVRNAILTYEQLPAWKSHRLEDVLKAHQMLMTGLVDAPGHLRSGNVGVYRDNPLIHMAPPAGQLARLMSDLLNWLKDTDIHPLIASSIFHYEFEFIHPFADGNGRMGRLWQTVILSQWRSELAWLAVETLIHNEQQDYYRVLGECDRASTRRYSTGSEITTISITPTITDITMPGTLSRLRPKVSSPIRNAAIITPVMLPEPPSTLTPPSTAMVMTLSSQPSASVGRVLPRREVSSTAASPDIRPTNTNSIRL